MGRTCTVCNHPDRDKINDAILRGVPYRAIARHYGVGRDAVRRHKKHIKKELKAAAEEAAFDLVGEARRVYLELREIAFEAMCQDPPWLRVAAEANRAAIDVLKTLGLENLGDDNEDKIDEILEVFNKMMEEDEEDFEDGDLGTSERQAETDV